MAVTRLPQAGEKANNRPQGGAQIKKPNGDVYVKLSETAFDPTAEGETRSINNSGYWVKTVQEI